MFQVAVFVCVGWIILVCLHEFSHAIVAYWGGDTSVKAKGYLTLNPLKYINFNYSLILPLIFLLVGGIALPGAAVGIDIRRLRNRWWQSAVFAAGPISSAIAILFLALLFQISLALRNTTYWWICPALAFLIFLQIIVTIINSLPIPPFDGYNAIAPWLPIKSQIRINKLSNYLLFFVLGLLLVIKPLNIFLGDLSTSIARFIGVPYLVILAGFHLFAKSSVFNILLVFIIGVVLLWRQVIHHNSYRIWYDRGKALMRSQNYQEAIAAFDKAIQHKSELYEVWFDKGICFENIQKTKRALFCFERALKINPIHENSWLCWYKKGASLYKLKRYEEALSSHQQATNINQNVELVWYEQGLSNIALKQYEEAVLACKTAIKLNPHHHESWYVKGIAYSSTLR